MKLQLETPYKQTTDRQNHACLWTIHPFVCNGCSTSMPFFGGGWYGCFATELRKDQKIISLDTRYRQGISSVRSRWWCVKVNRRDRRQRKSMLRISDTWNDSQNEAYFHDYISDLYGTEVEVYDTLEDTYIYKGITHPNCSHALQCPILPRRQRRLVKNMSTSLVPFYSTLEGFPWPRLLYTP